MTYTVQQLVALLERLPAAEQEKYGARWLGELLEVQGDGDGFLEEGVQPKPQWGPHWEHLSREARLKDLRAMLNRYTEGPGLSDEATRRESIYE